MDDLKLLGLAIKAVREAKGLSMRELAERAELATSTISVVEHGERDPNFNTLVAVCRVLGTKPSTLLSLAEKLGQDLPKQIERRQEHLRQEKAEIAKLSEELSSHVSALLASSTSSGTPG